MWKLLCVLSSVTLEFVLGGKLLGDHICISEESYKINVTEYHVRNATVRRYKWCMNVPPRCSYYTITPINDTRIVETIQTRPIEECCPGFKEENDHCISSCPNCKNGLCKDSKCSCLTGFTGENCESKCPQGYWGPNCVRKCDCDYQECDTVTGLCKTEQSNITIKPYNIDEVTTSTELAVNINETYTETGKKVDNNQEFTVKDTDYPFEIETKDAEMDNQYFPQNFTPQIFPKSLNNPTVLDKSTPEFINKSSRRKTQNTDSMFNGHQDPLLPVGIKYGQLTEPLLAPDAVTTAENHLNQENKSDIDHARFPNSLVNSVGIPAATTIILILFVVITLIVIHIRRTKEKTHKNMDNKKNVAVSTVSVYTTSIFHTPLPEPPTFENPTYLTATECQNCANELKTFESPLASKFNKQNRPKTFIAYKDYTYDHPPSTGSYRAASLIEPLDADVIQTTSAISEPVYDEIPSREYHENAIENSSYYSHPQTIYMNTCGNAKTYI